LVEPTLSANDGLLGCSKVHFILTMSAPKSGSTLIEKFLKSCAVKYVSSKISHNHEISEITGFVLSILIVATGEYP
jgi:hypothetical protein